MPYENDSSYFKRPNEEPITSTTFLGRLQGNEAGAWDDFMRYYAWLIRSWCRQWKNRLSRVERQDIAQSVYHNVWKSIAQFNRTALNGRCFRGWLWRITENQIMSYLKYRDENKEVTGFDWNSISVQQFPTSTELECNDVNDPKRESLDRRETMKYVLDLIKPDYEEKSWDVFRMLTQAGMNPSTVAKKMGMNVDAVRKIKSRIIRRIRAEFAKLGFDIDFPFDDGLEEH